MPLSRVSLGAGSADAIRPYRFHGLELSIVGRQGIGDCPFCGHEGKFTVERDSGLWRCWVCGVGNENGGGNPLVFIRLLHSWSCGSVGRPSIAPARMVGQRYRGGVLPNGVAHAATGANVGVANGVQAFYERVVADRQLAMTTTPAAWGVAESIIDSSWLVPGYGPSGSLDQLYKRIQIDGQWKLLPTPGLGWEPGRAHALAYAMSDIDQHRPNIWIMEGPWDGMAMWEAITDTPTATDTNIIAVPGANAWRDEWSEMCRGKRITLWYDSDHPVAVAAAQNRMVMAGYNGMKRIAQRLSGIAASVSIIQWGPDGYDPAHKTGWDVRDELSAAVDRGAALNNLLSKIITAPSEWFTAAVEPVNESTAARPTETIECSQWSDCVAAWGDAMEWRQDLQDALSVLLAVCASTKQAGNQLFLDLIGSPGSCKTTLCRGLLTSRHCIHLENVTKLISGYHKPGESGKDCSFLARANGKTWVTCEFDVLVSSHQYIELMGKVRRIFDGETSATYGNSDEDRIYTALRTPWIRAGTPRMMDHDQSQLGDRFLRFMIDDPSDSGKRSISRHALRSEREAMIEGTNCLAGSVTEPRTRYAQGLTGGYVDWLRSNTEEQLALVMIPESAEDTCIDLAELCADMRARPQNHRHGKDIIEPHNCKELPTRLSRQNVRLAACLAVVHNKRLVDADILRIVRKVALDTSYGHTRNIVNWMFGSHPNYSNQSYQDRGGIMEGQLMQWTGMGLDRLTNYLTFLKGIDVMRYNSVSKGWMLTDRVYELYLRIIGA